MIDSILKSIGYSEIKIKELIENYNIKEYTEEINPLQTLFLNLGLTEKIYDKFINTYPLNKVSKEYLYYNFISVYFYFQSEGYTNKKILKMTSDSPSIYTQTFKTIKSKINNLISLGFTKEDVIKITVDTPKLLSLSQENLKEKFYDISLLGFNKEYTIKILTKLPKLLSLNIENIKLKIKRLIDLGYTYNEVLQMCKEFPPLLGLNIDKIKTRIKDLIELGFNKEEVHNISKNFAVIFGLSLENIQEKIDFYEEKGLHELIVKNPKRLIQSITLTYARYQFLSEKNIVIGINNSQRLFKNEREFSKEHNISKEELLELYPYEEYKKKNNLTKTLKGAHL